MNKAISLLAVVGLSASIMACSDSNGFNGYKSLTQYDILTTTVNPTTPEQRTIHDFIMETYETPENIEKMRKMKAPNGKSIYQMSSECTGFLLQQQEMQNSAIAQGITLDEFVSNTLDNDNGLKQIRVSITMCTTVNVAILQQNKFIDNGDGTGRVTGNVM